MVRALSTDLDDPAARPYFVWDEELTFAELREHLASPDLRERALWTARVMREARYQDVWKLVRLCDVVADISAIEPHLGRMRGFWRWLLDGWRVRRGDESAIVDLVIDRAPDVDVPSEVADGVRIHSLREIASNKICALLGRGEVRDLIDLRAILARGLDLEVALADAERKDGGVSAATLAWILDQIAIGAHAELPGVAPVDLEKFRSDLVQRLRRLARPSSD